MTLIEQLQNHFPQIVFKSNEPLAPYTTVKIGGPAEVFCVIDDQALFIELVAFAKKNNIALTTLGWGANSLISDEGIKGLVIKNSVQDIVIHEAGQIEKTIQDNLTAPRWQVVNSDDSPSQDSEDLDYSEEDAERVKVTLFAGVSLPSAINSLLSKGITGLQWYSRIPATVGGAIYNNVHGGSHFIGELITSVKVVTAEGEIKTLMPDELEFEYDYSRFHHSNEVIISADFLLYKGDTKKAQQVSFEWAKRKAVQPQNSLGCVFQNISAEDQKRLELPTPSTGYLIEHVLELKGVRVGDAKISDRHAAFIENIGNATAKDYLAVIKKISTTAKEKCNLDLKPEIFFLGFTQNQLEGIVQPR